MRGLHFVVIVPSDAPRNSEHATKRETTLANIIDSYFEIAGTPAQIRAALDRVIANSHETPSAPQERCYIPQTNPDHYRPATWFTGADLTSPTIMKNGRVTFHTESKWIPPWHLIKELIEAGLDLRVLWCDDDGCLQLDEDTNICVNFGGFGEIRSIRNGVIYETIEHTFTDDQGIRTVTQFDEIAPVVDGKIDHTKIVLGLFETCAKSDEWLDRGWVAKHTDMLVATLELLEVDESTEPTETELDKLSADEQQRMMSRFFETLAAHDEKGRTATEIRNVWMENKRREERAVTLAELGIK